MERLKRQGKNGASNVALSTAAFLAVIMISMAAVTFSETRARHSQTYFHGRVVQSADIIEASTTEQLIALFKEKSFDLAPVQDGRKSSPRLIFTKFPGDLSSLTSPENRKEAFIKILLPAVLLTNEELEHTRARIIGLERRTNVGLSLSTAQSEWLGNLANRYDVEQNTPNGDGSFFKALLEHVDVIPVELALAQGGIESGWGTSRVALEGNAIFGQRVWKRGDEVGASSDVDTLYRAYDDVLDATRSYALNLNTHRAYAGFRKRRMEMRNAGNLLDAASLAGKLEKYSERGQDYIDQIRTVIAVNKLTDFSQARLTPK